MMQKIRKSLASSLLRWVRDDKAAVATEYAILLGVVALAIVVGATAFGTALNTDFNNGAARVSNMITGS